MEEHLVEPKTYSEYVLNINSELLKDFLEFVKPIKVRLKFFLAAFTFFGFLYNLKL